MPIKNLVAEMFLEPAVTQEDSSIVLHMGRPGGKSSRKTFLNTREMRILAYELLSAAETMDSLKERKSKKSH
jgi:hypothetical protein